MDLSPENLEAHIAASEGARASLEAQTRRFLEVVEQLEGMNPPHHVAEQLEAARVAALRTRHLGGVFLASRLNVLRSAKKAVAP